MKKFIAKVLVYFLIIAVITLCVNYIYIIRDDTNSLRVDKFENIPSSVMLCNFGSSHGNSGFNYADIEDMECFNFALTSQMPTYDKRVFDCYKDHISEGAVVFIPVSYFSCFGINETETDDFPEKNKRYYMILPPEMIKEFDLKTLIYVKYLPSLTAQDKLIRVLLGTEEDTNNDWSRTAWEIDVKQNAKGACQRHIFKNKIDENGNRIINQDEIDALEYIINGCYEKGCTPILVTTPFLSEYTKRIKKKAPDFFEDFYSVIDKITADTGVAYYDYAFDERFIHNYDWFTNCDHLNKEGARQFVDILMDEVVKYGSDESLIRY